VALRRRMDGVSRELQARSAAAARSGWSLPAIGEDGTPSYVFHDDDDEESGEGGTPAPGTARPSRS
jgi:hypothetical protein